MEKFSTSSIFANVLDWYGKKDRGCLLVIASSEYDASVLYQSIKTSLTDIEVSYFPAWDTLPYEMLTPSPSIRSYRIKTLYKLANQQLDLIITSSAALIARCPSPQFIIKNNLICRIKQNMPMKKFARLLSEMGYESVSKVVSHGQYTVRGSLIDVFPLGLNYPCRIDWFDDEIDSIRRFNTDDQLAYQSINQIQHLCAHEFLPASYIKKSDTSLIANFIENRISKKKYEGFQYFMKFFHDELVTFDTYLPKFTEIISQSKNLGADFNDFYKKHDTVFRKLDTPSLFLSPKKIWCYELSHSLNRFKHRSLIANTYTTENFDDNYISLGKSFLEKGGNRLLLTFTDQSTLDDVVKKIFEQTANVADNLYNFEDLFQKNGIGSHHIFLNGIGFSQNYKILIIALPGPNINSPSSHASKNKLKKTHPSYDPMHAFVNIHHLEMNDVVVHEKYGIGRYQGINRITIQGFESEFITIEFANSDRIHVPITDISCVCKYSACNTDNPPALSNLSSKKWSTQKKRAMAQIDQLTAQLLETHRARMNTKGVSIKPDKKALSEFANAFPFKLTVDQETAIKDTLSDLAAPFFMDRLICGDVGFGKTEVAMRAIFVTVINGYQALLLAPTTILAKQHAEAFKLRFKNYPVTIQLLSRNVTSNEKKSTFEDVQLGKIDIVIGTHAALNHKLNFKKLGLTVIDEEHRFGVKHKELLRQLHQQGNVLLLSATPIPRTLNMALSNLKSISVIQTPPLNRLPIISEITHKDSEAIENAIQREIMRGGQIYYVLNDISLLEKTYQRLKIKYPSINMAYAHGQMRAKQISKIMDSFYQKHCDMLMCTTIIESGIDIPNANTLIIERADLFGLSQLHQMRGRIGRSDKQAYAYFCIPEDYELNANARLRLEAIVSNTQIGAGFDLAMQDLEIRGAGEILGSKQSGLLNSIGMGTYFKLLKQNAHISTPKALIQIQTLQACYIPEHYMADAQERLEFYAQFASCETADQIKRLKEILFNRFGRPPETLKNLIQYHYFRCNVHGNWLTQILLHEKSFQLYINTTLINLRLLFNTIQYDQSKMKFLPPNIIEINMQSENRTMYEIFENIQQDILKMTGNNTKKDLTNN